MSIMVKVCVCFFVVTSHCAALGSLVPACQGAHLEKDGIDGIIRCESPLGSRLMKLKQLGDQIRICSADI